MVVELEIALPGPLALVMPAPGLLALVMPALGLVLPVLVLPALMPAGTRAHRLEQLKTRQRGEAPGLVRGRRQQQQLPRHRGAVAAAA